jgi:IPT/TIG domain/Regulator of chromosome condensation (RCC1) repeat
MTSSTRAQQLLRFCMLAALGILLLLPAGAAHATTSGTVVAWGCGGFAAYGQCNVPSGLNGVTAVAAGSAHSMALRSDGTVVAWGCGGDQDFGQCNVPSGLTGVTAIAAGGHSLALKSDGTVVAWGCGIDPSRCDIPSGLSDVTAIAAGGVHSLVLKSDGTVVAWGCPALQDDGQCDVPSGLSGVTAIAAGGAHSLGLKSDGTVVAWGCKIVNWGQCDVPSGLSGVVAIAAGDISSLALKSDGTVVAWGCGLLGDSGQCNVPAGLSGVTAIAAGQYHSLARKSDGTVIAWGCGHGDSGQCAVPSGLSGALTVAAGSGQSLALLAPAPKISGFSPGSAAVGTVVTISGVNLDGATAVSFTGNFGPESTTPTFVSATQVRAVVPTEAVTGPLGVTTPAGIAHSAGTFRVLPQITSITPGSGPAETAVTIGGSGFAGVSLVKFAGVPARALYFNHVLTGYVPPTALSGRITVTSGGVTVASPTVFLVVPGITTFAPSHAAPGSPVDVLGTGFGGVTSVKVNGVRAAFSVLSRTELRLTVPVGATDGPITITTAGGTATSAATLFVVPRVGSFTPGSAPVGTKVTITGNAFGGATGVLFNGVLALPATVTPTLITVSVPADASTGKLTVVTPSGAGESRGTFRVLPRITSVSPGSGQAGAEVTIAGSGFTDVSSVKFNGVADGGASVDSDHQITAHVPATATSGRITVTTAGGTATSAGNFLAVPTITGFAPAAAAPGSQVVVDGTGFGGVSSVKVHGVGASFSVLSRTQLRLTVPAGATDGQITVTTPGGTATSAATLLVTPRVAGFSPGSALVGAKVTISGNAFAGATGVLFNGVLALPATVTPTQITVLVPAAASTGKLTVVTPSGAGQSTATFRVLPRISSFSPGSGPAGTAVTITGSGFADVTQVKFNGISAASVSVDSDHQITAPVPAGATSGRITVTTLGGATTSATSFVVTH